MDNIPKSGNMAQQEDEKVKVVYHNDPTKFRFVTKQAASYLSTKWKVADDQSGASSPSGQKKAGAAPVESTIDKKAELRETYNELTGLEAKPEWNEARLFVEIEKAKKAPAQTETASTGADTETVIEEPAPTPKKRGPKKKNTEA